MKYNTVIDIGSSKVMCMTASPNADGAITIEGIGACEYRGYRVGSLPSPGALAAAAESAVNGARKESGVRARSACIGVPVPFTSIVINSLEVPVKNPDSGITQSDMDFLLDAAVDFIPPDGCSLMHSTPFSFRVDGIPSDSSPIGRKASKLGAKVAHSLVDANFKSLAVRTLKRLGIKAGPFVFTAMASARFTVPYPERKAGVILIDCGGTHCDVMSIVDGAVVSAESIGMGGTHITNDIAMGLRLPQAAAEKLKRNYKFNHDYGNSINRVFIPSEGIVGVENSTVKMIAEARVDELCEMLSDAVYKIERGSPNRLPVYMVGNGIALMEGGIEYLSRRIGRSVRCNISDDAHREMLSLTPSLGLAQFMLFGDGAAVQTGSGSFLQNIKEFFIS